MWMLAAGIALAALAVGLVYRYLDWKAERGWAPHEPYQVIVSFEDGVTDDERKRMIRAAGCTVMDSNVHLGTYTLRSSRKMRRVLEHFNSMQGIHYAEPNYLYEATYIPDDPFLPDYQYGPQVIQAPEAWDVTVSRPDVVIAILDTGVHASHPDLATKLTAGYNFVENNEMPIDRNGHGTHVAGIAAAATDNGLGIAGIAPNTRLLPVKVLGDNGTGNLNQVANGIIYAVNSGAQIINLSLGSAASAVTLQNAVRFAADRGVILVGAAGNNGVSVPNYPAAYSEVIAVASTTMHDVRSSFSNYGMWVDVAAPGDRILSTYLGGNYAYLSGTSMAAPHVSGVAALLVSQGRSQAEARAAIQQTADPVPGTGEWWVYGRVNAAHAVRYRTAQEQQG
ncbi:S8 family peptidase [Paenibacillus tarimensis]|uniref:S8 family peptidase n=1 Tax=Paenibacillus tarimensis TaxID=416012 RepID=UPI001F187657|nr:S8 family peptidase [Paenibacillus tarimensis]MCF2944305.1 S8 family peptidase [Paenibacillus tarimensis]